MPKPVGIYTPSGLGIRPQVGPVITGRTVVAPVFDAVSSGSSNGTGSITISHVMGAGANGILLVGASTDPVDMSAVPTATFNAVPMTLVPSSLLAAGINRTQWFYLLAPTAGTHNIVISWTSGNSYIVAGGVSFTGANQLSPLGTAATNSGSGLTASVNVTAASTSIVVDCLAFDRTGTTTATADASQAQQWNIAVTADKRGAASTKQGASSMLWTLSNSRAWALSSVGINGI